MRKCERSRLVRMPVGAERMSTALRQEQVMGLTLSWGEPIIGYEWWPICGFSVENNDTCWSDCLPFGSNDCRTCLVLLHFSKGGFVRISGRRQEIDGDVKI